MNYYISVADTKNHFIQLKYVIRHIAQNQIEVQLPAWRPGRYELQNFAKNIRNFQVTDNNNNPIAYKKLTKDRWLIQTSNLQTINISYQYYANQPDAGACFVDDTLLYINPVHCFMYVEGRQNEPYQLHFTLPDDYQIATQMKHVSSHVFTAPNFDYLADSPLFASNSMRKHSFKVNQTNIHFWFQGKHSFDMEQLQADTAAYALKQIDMFGELPSTDYHFLYLIHQYPARHGVEHLDSTVIALGQTSDQTHLEFYNDLLAISSHELFHLWNIKRIRPVDMLTYDFTKENYSTLGYVYEGVTTYYGDLTLLQSNVWSWEQYASSFNSDLKRHTDNEGRLNYSVAESSWDTWLDGYVAGVTGRKVSIYIEGKIAALVADLMIIKHSHSKHALANVMQHLYQQYYKQQKGYDEQIYKSLLEQYAGVPFNQYFSELIWGKGHLFNALTQALDWVGCHLAKDANGNYALKKNTQQTNQQLNLFNKWTHAN